MHFTTLFLLRNRTLENISADEIEEEFSNRFCYCCGETIPKYQYWCDWFQIGGRWNNTKVLSATNGFYGTNGCGNSYKKPKFSVVEVKDLTKKIVRKYIYAVATMSRIYTEGDHNKKFNELLDKIDNKTFKGVIALIDCHD